MTKWFLGLGALAILDVFAYRYASPAAQHDIKAVVIISLFMMSTLIPLRGATWLIEKSHAHAWVLGLATPVAIFAVFWTGYVFWAVFHGLVRSA